MKAPAFALLALSTLGACTQAPPDTIAANAHATTSLLGRSVTEIDPRIWKIHQVRNGDYWFGSNGSGVYRFDGKSITHYTEADGLCGDAVRGLHEDASGNVFIATTSGVSKFDGRSFATLEFVAEPTPLQDWVLNPNDLWTFAQGVRGPVRYDGKKLYHMQLSESPATVHQKHEAPFAWDPMDVYSVYKDRRGNVWFGTAGSGLCRYDGQQLSWMYEEQLTTTPRGGAFGIRSIFEDRAGHFWICNTRNRFEISSDVLLDGGNPLIKYHKQEGLPTAHANADENFTFYPAMIEDDAGALWMTCTTSGVWKYSGEGVTKYSIGDGAYTCCICRDLEGKLWVGTIEHGIYVFDGERFEPFEAPNAQTTEATAGAK